MTIQATASSVPVLIGGNWENLSADEYTDVYNPSTGEVIAQTPHCRSGDVGRAIKAASKAFETWSVTPVTKRGNLMFRFRELLVEHAEELTWLICKENGKTFDEAKGDLARGMETVEFACGIAHLSKGEGLGQVAAHIDAVTTREPLGVCAGITPFNFPAMIPLWMFPLAIATGNTFVLKPSPKVPLTVNRFGELFLEAGFPEGVLNIVQGGKEVVETLCEHPDIKGISFVGSSRVAKQVYSLGCQHGKRVQAAGEAKNVLLVMPDADVDTTVRAIIGSAFGCAGQRCMAGSLLMGISDIGEVKDHLLGALSDLSLGNTSEDQQVGMGPVIDGHSRNRLLKVIEDTDGAGRNPIVRDGRQSLPDSGFFVGPTLIDQVTPDQDLFKTELFGPILSVMNPSSLDEAVDWMNRLPYGNGASIFTQSGGAAREFARTIQCGMVGVNIGVPAPPPLFPFAGWNNSFFGDLHMQGTEGVQFYTRQKVVLSRWDNTYKRVNGW